MPTASPDPGTLMALSAIAYDDMHSIPGKVRDLGVGLDVVWGPAEMLHGLIPYSAAFIACNRASGEYTVVIRGTEPDSLSSWTGEDFDVGTTQPFSQFAGNAGSEAAISQGTCNGLNDLIHLRDHTGTGILGFLQAANPAVLYVTGHSLGGTLTPALFAYLNYHIHGGVYVESMAPCSFAGLTPGNAAFNRYFSSLVNPALLWRFYNTLDFAHLCWWSLPDIQVIYEPHLHYGFPEKELLDPLFAQIRQNGIDYQQPAGGYALKGSFNTHFLDLTWATQAMAQHHHGTYQSLVNARFPLPAGAAAQPQPQAEPLA